MGAYFENDESFWRKKNDLKAFFFLFLFRGVGGGTEIVNFQDKEEIFFFIGKKHY